MGLEPLSVLLCVCSSARASTLSNMKVTSWPIEITLYLKQHSGGGKAALGFGAEQIRTLVSMATNSSHNYGYNGLISVIVFSRLF